MAQSNGVEGQARARNTVKVNVPRSAVKEIKVVDTDLVFVLEDGRRLFIRDGAVQTMVDSTFGVEFSDGTEVSGQELLQSAGLAEITPLAVTGVQSPSDGAAGAVQSELPSVASTSTSSATSAKTGHSNLTAWLAVGTPILGGAIGVAMGGSGGSTGTTGKPATPVIAVVSGNDRVNANEKASGVTVSGSAEANASVTVIWGTTSKTITASATGSWTVNFASSELPGDATGTTISATVKSASGVSSDPATRTVAIDTAGPDAPVVADITGDNVIGPIEKANGVSVTGTAESGSFVRVVWGSVTKTITADAAGNWATLFTSAEVPNAGSYKVTVTATDIAGNEGKTAVRDVVVSAAVTVSGQIVAGPLTVGHGLTIDIYSGTGTLLATGVKVAADGSFVVSGLAVGQGEIIVARVQDASSGADYLDEATGTPTDVNAQFMAAGVVTSTTMTLNINPLTTIAALRSGLSADGTGTITNAALLAKANTAVAEAFGLTGINLLTTSAVAVNADGFNAADGLTSGEKIGIILATLSGLDLLNAGNAQATLARLSQLINDSATVARLLEQGQILVMEGAIAAQEKAGSALQTIVSDLISSTITNGQVKINAVATDNIISGSEVSGLTISGDVTQGATAVTLTIGTRTVTAALSGTSWSYRMSASDITDLGADGAKLLKVQANFSSGEAVATRLVTLKVTPPAAPVIDAISTDNFISAAEKLAGVSISGTGEAGSTINLQIGSLARSAVVSASGIWSIALQSSDIGADGTVTVTATAADGFGNVSAPATRSLTVDTAPPSLPVINSVTGDDLIGPVEKIGGVQIEGTSEAFATVRLTFGSVTRTTTANAAGVWSISVLSSQIPDDGDYVLSAIQTDRAGNVSAEATRTIKVDAQPPAKPVITVVSGDDVINANEKLAGIVLRGTAEAGSIVEISWGSVTKTARAGANGAWSASYTGAQVPADGSSTIRARATDSTGNVSEDATRTVTIDTLSQTPLVDIVSADGVINAVEKSEGVVFTGTAEPGANVSVTIAGITKRASANPSGGWSVTFGAADLPGDGTDISVSVQSTDVAGNVSAAGIRTFSIDTLAPTRPTIAVVAGDDAINALERTAAVEVRGTADAGASVSVTWGGTTRVATADSGGDWVVVFSAAQIPGDGTEAISAVARDTAGNVSIAGTRSITLDSSTSAPVINVLATDDVINAAEKAAGVTVTGSAEANASVRLVWGTVIKTVTAGSDGIWSQSFTSAEIPVSGASSITATATDKFGNAGTPTTRNFTIDTAVDAASFDAISGDNRISSAEKALGVNVNGSAEAGASVAVTWAGTTINTTADSSGRWTVFYAAASVPADGTSAVTAVVTDLAGNVNSTGSRSVTVDTIKPSSPTVDIIAGDNIVNEAEWRSGVRVSGKAEAFAVVEVTWGTKASKFVTADAAGDWFINFAQADMPTSGTSSVLVRQTDLAGNTSDPVSVNVKTVTGTPLPPAFNQVTSDNVVNKAEKEAGVVVSGTAQAGNTVVVSWGIASKSALADEDGNWTVTFSAADIPSDASATIISATQADLNGNISPTGTWFVDVDTSAPDAPTIATVIATDNVINLAEKNNGVVVSGTGPSNTSVTVTWGGLSRTVTSDGSGNWSLLYAIGQIPADAATVPITVYTSDPAGNRSGEVVRNVRIDTAAPTLPTIGIVSGDDRINRAERDAGIEIAGTAEAGSTIYVTWGANIIARAVTVNGLGVWSTTISSADIPADGASVISVTATDSAGNSSEAATRDVAVGTSLPSTPVINPITADNMINAAEQSAGVTISGTGTAGRRLIVTFGSASQTLTVASDGSWSATFSPSEVPAEGGPYQVTAKQVDLFGNESATPATRTYSVDITPPADPSINLVASDDVVNAAEKAAGVTVTGSAEANSSVQVTWGGAVKTVTASSLGSWSAYFLSADVPADIASAAIKVKAVDAAGNASNEITRSVRIDASVPLAPGIALSVDTGALSTDGVTSNGVVTVSGIEPGIAFWEYLTDGGTTWLRGTGTSFTLSEGVYAIGSVQVRQTDTAGNVSAVTSNLAAITIDQTFPTTPSFALAEDTGSSATDGVTSNDVVSVSGLDAGVPWQYTVNAGSTWLTGSGSSFTLAAGTYAANAIRVRQTDVAGNISTSLANIGAITIDKVVAALTVTRPSDTGQSATDGITSDNVVGISGLETGATWRYSIDSGVTYTVGTGSNFSLSDGTYAIGAIRVQHTDLAGNVATSTVNTAVLVIDRTFPVTPSVALAADTGSSSSDGVTRNNVINVTGLEAGISWQYSVNGGIGWTDGTGTSFVLVDGSYAANAILVRQTDLAGNRSTSVPGPAVTIDTSVATPVLALSQDTGASATDGVTTNGFVNITSLEAGATWELSVNGGASWTSRTGSSFSLAEGTYAIGAVRVRQTDIAGNISTGSNAIAFIIDQTAPVGHSAMSSDYGTNGDYITNQNAVVIGGMDRAGTVVTLSLSDGATFASGTATTASVTADSFGAWLSPTINLATLAYGSTTTLTYTVTDLAGLSFSSSQVITKASAPMTAVSLGALDAAAGFKVVGTASNENLGIAFASGDVNNDGRSDMIIGSPGAKNGALTTGEVSIIYGVTSRAGTTNLDTSTLGTNGFIFRGTTSGEQVGRSVAFLGDMNGDGISDFVAAGPGPAQAVGNTALIPTPQAGSAYIVFGSATQQGSLVGGKYVMTPDDLTTGKGFIVRGTSGDALGVSVAGIGDVNNDGIADMAIGLPLFDYAGATDVGAVMVIYGRTDGLYGTDVAGRREISVGSLTASQGFIISGGAAQDYAGFSVASAGDFNGDGINDMILGQYGRDRTYQFAGAAYVIYGKAGGAWSGLIDDPTNTARKLIDLTTLSVSDGFRVVGEGRNGNFGQSVSSAGDVNGDGYADVIIGNPRQSPTGGGSTATSNFAYVVFGGPTSPGTVTGGVSSINAETLTSTQGFAIRAAAPIGTNTGDYTGQAVGAAGDVNGDGIADMFVGAPLQTVGGTTNVGGSYIIFGRKDGNWGVTTAGKSLLTLADLGAGDGLYFTGDRVASENNGYAESYNPARDLNNDGINDFFIPSWNGDTGSLTNNGEASFIYGSATAGGLNLAGTAAQDVELGSQYGDVLTGGGGADYIMGYGGSDTIIIPDLSFLKIDAGAGDRDTLRLVNGLHLNLPNVAAGALAGIEQIDLVAGSHANTLTVTQQTLINLSDTSDRLIVTGDAADRVNATGFVASGTQSLFGVTYNVYTSGTAALWTQQAVQVVI